MPKLFISIQGGSLKIFIEEFIEEFIEDGSLKMVLNFKTFQPRIKSQKKSQYLPPAR
jgi:hypothetical protein